VLNRVKSTNIQEQLPLSTHYITLPAVGIGQLSRLNAHCVPIVITKISKKIYHELSIFCNLLWLVYRVSSINKYAEFSVFNMLSSICEM